MEALKGMLAEVQKEVKTGGSKAKQGSIVIKQLSVKKDGSVVLVANVGQIAPNRAVYKDKDGVEQTSSSINLVRIGKGNFGQNVANCDIDGDSYRCNISFKVNLTPIQIPAESDLVIAK